MNGSATERSPHLRTVKDRLTGEPARPAVYPEVALAILRECMRRQAARKEELNAREDC